MKLDLYRQGVDPYIYNAAETFNVSMDQVTKDQRQAGKIQELALQFLGGVGALRVMGRNYGMKITEGEAEMLRDAWRRANPWARQFGEALESAAMRAVMRPGTWEAAGRIQYAYDGGDWLWCKLPSGRLIAYFQPRLENVETPWGDERLAVTCVWGAAKPKVAEPWPRRAMHPGLYIENVTQATAGCLLRNAVVRCHEAGLVVCLHVHDEIVVEGSCADELGKIMLNLPAWAEGLPVTGGGGTGTRYGK
jgi:DNA polymerase